MIFEGDMFPRPDVSSLGHMEMGSSRCIGSRIEDVSELWDSMGSCILQGFDENIEFNNYTFD